MAAQRHSSSPLGCRPPGRGVCRDGFTFVEFLVALAIGAAVIGVVATVLVQISGMTRRGTTSQDVTMPTGVLTNFYGSNSSVSWIPVAPSYGRAMRAAVLREKFLDDVDRASAVFCLGRNARSTIRPANLADVSYIPIDLTNGANNYDPRVLDSPDSFRTSLLNVKVTGASTIFDQAYSTAAALKPQVTTATNLSIFIFEPSESQSFLKVRSVYEVDFATASSPSGTMASVRRYAGTNAVPTEFYDVFYPSSTNTVAFSPLAAFFQTGAMTNGITDPSVGNSHPATRPTYLIWWPDPSQPTLEGATAPTLDANDARYDYRNMAGRTQFFFVVPQFPAL